MIQIEIPFIDSDVLVTFCSNEWNSFLEERSLLTEDCRLNSASSGRCLSLTAPTVKVRNKIAYHRELYLIYVSNKFTDVEILKILVHEMSHAVSMIIESKHFSCDEFRSYLLDYLCGEVFKVLKVSIRSRG